MTIYTVYYQLTGDSLSMTNLRLLSEHTGMGEEKLKYHFVRNKKRFYRYKGVIIIRSDKLLRGAQRYNVKG